MPPVRTTRRVVAFVLVALSLGLTHTSLIEGEAGRTETAYPLLTDLIKAQLPEATAAVPQKYVFTAAPLESAKRAHELYTPIARYLSKVTGKHIVYQHPRDWRAYQKGLRDGEYDLAFDSPHFVSWRIATIQHEPLARIAMQNVFVVLTRKDAKQITGLAHLAGRPVCGKPPLDEGTLDLYHHFDNPARQPVLVRMSDGLAVYQAMIEGRCDAAIVPLHTYEQADPNGEQARVLFKSEPTPGQALTAGPRLSAEDKAKITEALLSPEGQKVTKKLCKRFQAKGLVEASKPEYTGLAAILRNTWGFDIQIR